MGPTFFGRARSSSASDQSNLINERIAKRIIELAKTSELNPDL
jgi:hypothetical protein